MDFPKILKQNQLERHMTCEAFAKHLGKSRAWLQIIYTKNPSIKKYKLSELTMQSLYEKLNIPICVMEEYNDMVRRNQ